ncbi:MAG: NAD(P)-dependent oxidoreductase [Verrucomicrobia bacterium]|jgi:3-hydroxyisobutyrate dehydrogenase|nr:NAD(P)-dependent oxidoreductase [Verrucomicrobiota bacterium]MBT5061612.1 NAD(P)-dependent oxidoreductase [Verrucomicrobiota bacterium]MBT5480964.1 NAD(P)-dependent oxidoreductase [Verrucomicrobiota bacterium]MBT6236966.1 NAD(P)-dependent oxidoreductase [Verrucomicrobiota bacterium]MBT6805784.1 NAD(P)-dependent oxidoreductase [Verrucomicrobiota bacterium]
MDNKPVIGFIGIGVMGRSMAGHLLNAGYPLHVHNRTQAKAQDLLDKGAQWQDSPGKVAAVSDVIITIVGFPNDVEAVYLGDDGILTNARAGSTVIDMTTSCPDLAQKIAEQAKTKGISSFDAPVSGGDIGAREARLSIMVGGDVEVFEKIKPLFEIMGKNIVLQGPAGSGQHTKMCNQIAIASGMMAISEAMAYARKSGLKPETVLKSIESGAAGSWSLTNLAPRVLKEDFAPGFFVKHFIKDMKIAIGSAENMGLDLPGLQLAKQLYEKLADRGCEDDGTQALFKLYQDQI